MGDSKIRVLVVDDSLLFRSLLSNILKDDNQIEVVGTAMHGRAALSAIPQTMPDIITLDVEMPEMDGIECLEVIRDKFPDIQVIMVSATTFEGAANTIKSMELGAYDFFLKSGDISSSAPEDKINYVKSSLLDKD